MAIEYARHTRNTDTVHLDTTGVAHEKYIRGEPTPVEAALE